VTSAFAVVANTGKPLRPRGSPWRMASRLCAAATLLLGANFAGGLPSLPAEGLLLFSIAAPGGNLFRLPVRTR
jgi:hypothetical protein